MERGKVRRSEVPLLTVSDEEMGRIGGDYIDSVRRGFLGNASRAHRQAPQGLTAKRLLRLQHDALG